ncbi:MAG: hypothetical protein M1827_006585 [Pycnora praestabilis]|nr:MAG: hypothetical protein M1827_006585 [Pycnora praestabilis]
MSSTAAPISPEAFAIAIQDLPLSNLHNKAAEIRNSIAHLRSSNLQLQAFADEGDQDCLDAIRENEEVVGRMGERIALLRHEVESRGYRWSEMEVEDKAGNEEVANGIVEGTNGIDSEVNGSAVAARAPGTQTGNGERRGGRLTDEEIAQRLRDMMGEDEDGVHL